MCGLRGFVDNDEKRIVSVQSIYYVSCVPTLPEICRYERKCWLDSCLRNEGIRGMLLRRNGIWDLEDDLKELICKFGPTKNKRRRCEGRVFPKWSSIEGEVKSQAEMEGLLANGHFDGVYFVDNSQVGGNRSLLTPAPRSL